MRTSIQINDALMATAMQAGPFKTKKAAIEAGLQLLARKVTYREILKWHGKLKWEGDESIDWVAATKREHTQRNRPEQAAASAIPLSRPARGRD
jgi:antitoxin ParD1/3/4